MFGLDFGILTFTWIAYSSAILATRRNWSQLPTPDALDVKVKDRWLIIYLLPC
jgi:hypothetical protein